MRVFWGIWNTWKPPRNIFIDGTVDGGNEKAFTSTCSEKHKFTSWKLPLTSIEISMEATLVPWNYFHGSFDGINSDFDSTDANLLPLHLRKLVENEITWRARLFRMHSCRQSPSAYFRSIWVKFEYWLFGSRTTSRYAYVIEKTPSRCKSRSTNSRLRAHT